MENNLKAPSENTGTKTKTIKQNIVHRYIKLNLKTPYRIVRDRPTENESRICLTHEDTLLLIEQYENYATYRFYDEHKAYIPVSEQKLEELSSYSSYVSGPNLIERLGKPISERIKTIEEIQKPLLCVDDSVANLACMLIYARLQANLTKKYWEDLPDGEELLLKADNHFEELCSGLKIGRRTRSIINRKKVEGQANAENLTDNIDRENY